jgi:hypothetical protein
MTQVSDSFSKQKYFASQASSHAVVIPAIVAYAAAGNACREWGIVAACGLVCGRVEELERQEG